MKNILFLHSSSELYGSDKSLLNLIKNLDKNKFNISVILPCDGPLVEEMKKVKKVNVILKEIAVLRRKNLSIVGLLNYGIDFFKSISFLKKIIKKNSIDIVYTNTAVVFPGGVVAKLCGKKSIWHVREIIKSKFEKEVVSLIVYMFSDVIIANSKATSEAICKNQKKNKVVYNAIEFDENGNVELQKHNRIIIGMAGRINRWKGQKLFVDMAARVVKENPNVEFLIAGDVYKGEEQIRIDLKEYIKERKMEQKIKLLGQVKDMNNFYSNIDIFVLPSIQPEPFGLVVIEAMAKKLPVVATNHGGPVEIIEDRKSGFLIDYKDAEEMKNVILELVANDKLRKNIGEYGRERAIRTFSLEKYINSISNILLEV